MIVGNGDIASVLPLREDLLFFASGVSNSQEDREEEYQREIDLLLEQPKDKRLVYFSSLSIFYLNNRYQNHKKDMETMIKENFPKYCILRLGNISWGDNPHTLINYLASHPNAEIRDEYRFVIGIEEFMYWINLIPDWNCEMNTPGKWMSIKEIYNEFVAKV